ncbi:MAG TPA: glycosyltransferase family 1 protein [Gammaproteobacteria bacterium]
MGLPHVGMNAISLLSPLTGVGQYTYHLSKALVQAGADVSYFYGPVWSDRLLENEVDVRAERDASSRLTPFTRKAMVGAKRLVKTVVPRPYEVVRFLQQRWFTRGLRSRSLDVYHDPNFIPFRFHGPTVITVHDLSVLTLPHMHPSDRVRAIGGRLKWAVEQADAIITVSEFVREEVIESLGVPGEKVTAIHNGVDSAFRPRDASETAASLSRLGLRHARYVLGVGTLEPRKNLGRLCRAYRSLPEEVRQEFPLVLAGMKGWGESEFARDLEALIQEGNLVLPGYLESAALRDLYAGAALFAYPSVYEGFGLPVVEAMASGVPVMTSNCSSLPEVAGDAAQLVNPLEVDDIAAALARLLNDSEERHCLATAGLKRASEYTWDITARKTLAVYDGVRSRGS